jgi:hypothetical protein
MERKNPIFPVVKKGIQAQTEKIKIYKYEARCPTYDHPSHSTGKGCINEFKNGFVTTPCCKNTPPHPDL